MYGVVVSLCDWSCRCIPIVSVFRILFLRKTIHHLCVLTKASPWLALLPSGLSGLGGVRPVVFQVYRNRSSVEEAITKVERVGRRADVEEGEVGGEWKSDSSADSTLRHRHVMDLLAVFFEGASFHALYIKVNAMKPRRLRMS
nr:CASP-like protein 4A3 isoform X1 [Ipomoea batatas]